MYIFLKPSLMGRNGSMHNAYSFDDVHPMILDGNFQNFAFLSCCSRRFNFDRIVAIFLLRQLLQECVCCLLWLSSGVDYVTYSEFLVIGSVCHAQT